MNWTGGRLSRHSRNAGSLSSRQKQHFAKVQTNLRNGAKKNGPHKWSIFGNIVESQRPPLNFNDNGRDHGQERSQSIRSQDDKLHMHRNISRYIEPCYDPAHQIREIKVEETSAEDDDLYDATPPPQKTKRERETSENKTPSEEELVAEKRRRLLKKDDWVGTSIQRPMQLTYIYPEHGEDVGRRKKATDGHRARYSKPTVIISPFATRTRRIFSQDPRTYENERLLGRSDVRISIGGRVVSPGISSSTGTIKHHRDLVHPQSLEQARRASSDVMLLDNDEEISGRNDGSFCTQEEASERQDGHQEPSNRCFGASPNRIKIEMNELPHNSRRLLEEYSTRCSLRKRYRMKPSQASAAIDSPVLGVFTSSSTSMRHPKPRSSRISVLLQSDSSESVDSTLVHVGRIESVSSSTKASHNEIWKTWMEPLHDEETRSAERFYDQQDNAKRLLTSPDIRTVGLAFYGGEQIPASRNSRSSNQQTTDQTGDHYGECSRKPSLQVFSRNNSGRSIREPIETRPKMEVEEFLLGSNICPRKHDPVGPIALLKGVAKEKDMDNMWRKFVFGSSSDDIASFQNA